MKKIVPMILFSIMSLNNTSLYAQSNTSFKVGAKVLAGCLISMSDIDFGVININKELIEKVEASSTNPTARVLYDKTVNFNFRCPNNTTVYLRSNGTRNMINKTNPEYYLHYDVKVWRNGWYGIHTNPISIIANGQPQFEPVTFAIMSPYTYGGGTMPVPGVYTNNLPMEMSF